MVGTHYKSEYNVVFVNHKFDQFHVLQSDKWEEYMEFGDQKFCVEELATYSSNSDICAIELLGFKEMKTCKLNWYYSRQFWQRIDVNKWLFVVKNETVANITCKKQ